MKKILMRGFIVLMIVSGVASADTTQMNQSIVRMINQIDGMMPLIDQAKTEQNPSARVKFHFDEWSDANGQMHSGLRQDLMRIRSALKSQINQSNLTPKTVQPIDGDFVGR